ncbi:MAG: PHP domain-containing protein, partial [Parvularculaceae bacterium]
MAAARVFPMTGYAELSALSNFSFLRGASHPDELVFQAASLEQSAVAITDINSFAGIVRGHVAAKEAKFPFIVGVRLGFADGTPDLLAYPENRAAYGRLSRLLTRGKRRAKKGACHLTLADALEFGEGQFFALAPDDPDAAIAALDEIRNAFPKRLWLAASRRFDGADRARLNHFADVAARARVPLLATNNVLYHSPRRRPLQDILHCIREHVTIDRAGRALEANAERHLKAPAEMAQLFADHPAAIEETVHIASRIRFSLDELRYEYPEETSGESATPQEELERLAALGAKARYPNGVPQKVAAAIEYELRLIGELSYAPYFLTVHDIVVFARSIGILCQGRGSAANSAVCFCLGVTSVDPDR